MKRFCYTAPPPPTTDALPVPRCSGWTRCGPTAEHCCAGIGGNMDKGDWALTLSILGLLTAAVSALAAISSARSSRRLAEQGDRALARRPPSLEFVSSSPLKIRLPVEKSWHDPSFTTIPGMHINEVVVRNLDPSSSLRLKGFRSSWRTRIGGSGVVTLTPHPTDPLASPSQKFDPALLSKFVPQNALIGPQGGVSGDMRIANGLQTITLYSNTPLNSTNLYLMWEWADGARH